MNFVDLQSNLFKAFGNQNFDEAQSFTALFGKIIEYKQTGETL